MVCVWAFRAKCKVVGPKPREKPQHQTERATAKYSSHHHITTPPDCLPSCCCVWAFKAKCKVVGPKPREKPAHQTERATAKYSSHQHITAPLLTALTKKRKRRKRKGKEEKEKREKEKKREEEKKGRREKKRKGKKGRGGESSQLRTRFFFLFSTIHFCATHKAPQPNPAKVISDGISQVSVLITSAGFGWGALCNPF